MDSKGMLAIVRGLPDSGLMVTLMDGEKQYTLLPQTDGVNTTPTYDVCNDCISRQSQCGNSEIRPRQECGAQAVDGRYASSYKLEYCNMKPTSPPVESTEFPPQHSRLEPGRGNFEVGGVGSGGYVPRTTGKRTYSNCRATAAATANNASRSHAFASSLRKYPSVSPDSSSEVFERLISFSKPSDSSRTNYPNECLTCYQVTPSNRYPKYKNIDVNKTISNRRYDVSPTRYEGLHHPDYNNICKYHEHLNDMFFGKSNGIHSKHPYHKRNTNNKKLHGSKVVSGAVSDVATLNESSCIDISMSPLASEENLSKQKDSNLSLEALHLHPHYLRDNKSIQTLNSLTQMRTTRKRKAHRKAKKKKSSNQTPAKNKKMIQKARLPDDSVDTTEHKRLKRKLLALIRELNTSEEDIEDEIRSVLCKLLNCILRHRKSNYFNENVMDKLTKQCGTQDCSTESADYIKQTLDLVWKKYSSEAAEIQRVIKDDLLPILKYHLFKENENEVINFILSKIIKEVVDVVKKIECKYLTDSRNSFDNLSPLDKPKAVRDNKKIHPNIYKSPGKKCRRYPNSSRLLLKTETTDNLNNNILKQSNDPIDLKLQSIVNIYQVLKKIQSSSEFQANYVTSMLLNRFCTTKAYANEMKNYHPKVRPRISPAKCISDTYIMIHNSSRNKSILTKKKIDKLNLHGGTQLLTSIKNECTEETNLEHMNKKYEVENITIPDKPQTKYRGAVYMADHSSNPFSQVFPEKRNEENDKRKEDISKLNHASILHQIEEKIRQWFVKFGFYTINNNVCYNNILRNLTEDLTIQITRLNRSPDTTRECVSDYLKCVICKHLFLPISGQSFQLAQKLTELTEDVLSVFALNTTLTGNIKAYEKSPTPSTSEEKECNTPKPPSILPGSHIYQADRSVMKDIYSNIMLCDENILQVLPRDLLKQDAECNFEEKCTIGGSGNHENDNDKNDSKGLHGEIKLVLTTTNTNNSENNESTCPKEPNSSNARNVKDLPENPTRQQLHEYCVDTFRNYCRELPILATNPDLTELAREGVLHNILKLFYMLIEDSNVANDYTYFEFCFEDEIDGLLDVLPQTEEMKRMRQGWKTKVVMEAVKILKFMHKTKDDSEFQQKLYQVSDRRKLMVEQRLDNDYSQQLNALKMAEKFLTSSNYREKNPLKVKIYMQRLMDRANQIYESVKRKEGKPFLELPIEAINEIVLREFQTVAVPNNDIEKPEIDLVEINNQIEAWFNELPVIPPEGININKRKILKLILARKIHATKMNLDRSTGEREMKHEISVFLSDKAIGLEKDQDLNINYMVEDLANRLRRRQDDNSLDYESFKKHLPISSSIQKLETSVNGDFNKPPYISQNVKLSKNNERVRFEDQISNQDKIVKLQPIGRSTERGVIGTSQTPGPSSDEAYMTLSSRPRTLNSQEAPQRYPNTISQRKKIFHPEELNEISKFFSVGGSNGSNKTGFIRFSKVDPSQRSDYHSIRDYGLHNSNQNNVLYDNRQELFSKSPHVDRYTASTSAAQAVPPYLRPINYNNFRRNSRNDYDMDYDMEYERERDQSRIHCKCGEASLRRRRRHSCHCEDFYPMPSCCFLHNDF